MQGAKPEPGHARRVLTMTSNREYRPTTCPAKRNSAGAAEGALGTAAQGPGEGFWVGMVLELLAEGDEDVTFSLPRYQHR